MAKIQKIKGFVDLFPEEAAKFTYMENAARDTFTRYGFGELRTPVLEKPSCSRSPSVRTPTWWARKCSPFPTARTAP